jgi:hypothetical protein
VRDRGRHHREAAAQGRQRRGAKAHNLFPEVQAVRANYNDFATLVTKAAMKMISTQEPTAKALADLQAELERQVPLK